MDAENDVIRLAGELSVAVEVIMNPNVSQQARMDAYVACEKYVQFFNRPKLNQKKI